MQYSQWKKGEDAWYTSGSYTFFFPCATLDVITTCRCDNLFHLNSVLFSFRLSHANILHLFPSKKGDMDGVGSHVWSKWDKESFSLSPWIQQCDFRRTKSSDQKVFFVRQVTGCVVRFSMDNPFRYMIFGMIKTTKALVNRFWLYASDFHTRVKVGTEIFFFLSVTGICS